MFTPFEIAGIGIHTGVRCAARVSPGREPGVVFETAEGPIRLRPGAIDPNSSMATDLVFEEARVRTVEHLLAALSAFSTNDFRVEVDGPEIPILDGSSVRWVAALDAAGAPRGVRTFEVAREMTTSAGRSRATLRPIPADEEPVYRVELDYVEPWPMPAEATFRPLADDLATALAPARTYALAREVTDILGRGLAKGGSLDNALVIGDGGPLGGAELRFADEPARHKLLDAVGDLFTTGALPRCHLFLFAPGHRLNHELARVLVRETVSGDHVA